MLGRFRPKSEFSSNVLTLMTGTTIAQAIPIAISPILTRIYTPEDFGMFALFIAIVSIFGTIATARYESAIMLPSKDEDAINIFALGLIINSFISIFLLILIILFHESLLLLLNNTEIGFWLYFVPLSTFLIGLFNSLKYFNNRKKYYKDIANTTIIKAIIVSATQLLMGFLKFGIGGLVTSQIFSQLFGNIKLLRNVIKDKLLLGKITKNNIFLMAKKYKNFPKYQMLHAIFNSLTTSIPIFIFTSFFSSTIVGFYSLALKILFAPLMIISGASAAVYNQTLSELYNSGGNSYSFTMDFLISLLKKIIIPFLLIVIFAPELFAFIFGEKWKEAGVYTQILSPYILFNVLTSSVAFIAPLVKMQKKALLVSIVHIVLTLLALLISVLYDSIYLSLFVYMMVMLGVLIYNLIWMLQALKKVSM